MEAGPKRTTIAFTRVIYNVEEWLGIQCSNDRTVKHIKVLFNPRKTVLRGAQEQRFTTTSH
jgi:hypothetical protein